ETDRVTRPQDVVEDGLLAVLRSNRRQVRPELPRTAETVARGAAGILLEHLAAGDRIAAVVALEGGDAGNWSGGGHRQHPCGALTQRHDAGIGLRRRRRRWWATGTRGEDRRKPASPARGAPSHVVRDRGRERSELHR